MDYINQHYNEKLRISELATYIGVNRSYLTSSFKKVTGYSPQEYLMLLRMDKAASMLTKTDIRYASTTLKNAEIALLLPFAKATVRNS